MLSKIKNKTALRYFLGGIGFTIAAFYLLFSVFFTSNNHDGKLSDFPQGYKIISPSVPDKIYFAGEKVPLENFEVFERVDREIIVNTYWHSSTILSIKRAARWFPVIEPILKQNNIPDDFKYLAVAESNLENVISPAGATGFWQFIESAAREFGLEVNSEIDERYDVEKSTVAACKYLRSAYDKFGSWTSAAASYNMGISGIENQRSRQKANNYYNLVLGAETSRYIARIVAIKSILQDPPSYGFDLEEDDLYKPFNYKEVILNSSVADFADYAASLDINYKTLKLYNPWLRDNSLKNSSGKTYKIKIPEDGSIELIKE